jgi:hypothetical protein
MSEQEDILVGRFMVLPVGSYWLPSSLKEYLSVIDNSRQKGDGFVYDTPKDILELLLRIFDENKSRVVENGILKSYVDGSGIVHIDAAVSALQRKEFPFV